MRWVTPLCFAFAAAAILPAPARAQVFDEWLKLYAVHIYRTGYATASGNGIYLGNGVILTAAHVAGLGIWRRPKVEIAGKMLPTSVIKDGHFYRKDIELLRMDQNELPMSLALRRMPLCAKPLPPLSPVVVATPENTVRSVIVPPKALPADALPDYGTAIAFVKESGASGSGVFDANTKCLAGMITRLITRSELVRERWQYTTVEHPVAKYFIPASDIAAFMPKWLRF